MKGSGSLLKDRVPSRLSRDNFSSDSVIIRTSLLRARDHVLELESRLYPSFELSTPCISSSCPYYPHDKPLLPLNRQVQDRRSITVCFANSLEHCGMCTCPSMKAHSSVSLCR